MLSVVIVNWNTKEFLRSCLGSLRANPCSEEMEVIVVDNASTDGSADMGRSEFPEFTLIESGGNVGYAKGNNLGLVRAKGEFVLTLNPDTEILEDTLDMALHVLRSNPDCGGLGAHQIDPDGATQNSVRGFPSFWGILGYLTGLGKLAPRSVLDSYGLTSFDYTEEQIAPQPMGTFLLFRRSALEAVGGRYDESFPIFFNEVDLLYRMKLAGYPCIYSPAVRILHHGAASTKQVRKSMIWESHKSLARFLRKHHRTTWSAPFVEALCGVVWLAALVRAKGYHGGFGT